MIRERYLMKIAMSRLILEMFFWKGVPKIVLTVCKITFPKTQSTNYYSVRPLIALLAWKVLHRQISSPSLRMPRFRLNFFRGNLIKYLRVKVEEFKMCGIKQSKQPNLVSTLKTINQSR